MIKELLDSSTCCIVPLQTFVQRSMQRNRGKQQSGKISDLFKKMRDTKEMFHAKMGSKKDRNGMDLTEAEEMAKVHRRTVQKRSSRPR